MPTLRSCSQHPASLPKSCQFHCSSVLPGRQFCTSNPKSPPNLNALAPGAIPGLPVQIPASHSNTPSTCRERSAQNPPPGPGPSFNLGVCSPSMILRGFAQAAPPLLEQESAAQTWSLHYPGRPSGPQANRPESHLPPHASYSNACSKYRHSGRAPLLQICC